MASYQVLFNGSPADDAFHTLLSKLEVEENADLPDAFALTVPVGTANGDLTWVSDDRFAPYANVAVVVTDDSGTAECIFDGYVLTQQSHLEPGITGSTVTVWGQDASVLLGLEEKVREWSGLTDGAVANQIFGEYGVTPSPANTNDDSPAHTEDGHTLMQRASDIDFLRRLARRDGRWCRVSCADRPGQRTGMFAPPDLGTTPVVTIDLTDPKKASVASLEFRWDVSGPSSVSARQASLSDADPEGVGADAADSGLAPLDARGLRDFAGRDVKVVLTASADAPELPQRARALLRDSGWFTRCEGSADLASLTTVPRVGGIVGIEGVGSLLSGSYLIWSVRHTITQDRHAMAFTLVRNAVGPAPAAGGLGSLLGAVS